MRPLTILIAFYLIVIVHFELMGKTAEITVKQDTQWTYCTIETGDVGDFKYRAETMQDAMNNVSEVCLDARLKLHKHIKGIEADEERYEEYTLACVNSVSCTTDD